MKRNLLLLYSYSILDGGICAFQKMFCLHRKGEEMESWRRQCIVKIDKPSLDLP